MPHHGRVCIVREAVVCVELPVPYFLCMYSVSSNVTTISVERSLASVKCFLWKISKGGDETNPPLPLIMKDKFGNYIVQRFFE